MNFTYATGKPEDCSVESIVFFVPEFKTLSKQLKELDRATNGSVSTLFEAEEFTGEQGQISQLMNADEYKAKRIILVGLGSQKSIDHDSYRKASGRLSRHWGLMNSQSASIYFDSVDDLTIPQAVVEGLILGAFKQLEFKTGDGAKDKNKLTSLQMCVGDRRSLKRLEKGTERGAIIAEGQVLVRTLAGTPANYLTPPMLAKEAQKLARTYGLKCKILDEKVIEKEKMGALLSVSQGSVEPPRFIILEHQGGKATQKPIVLVGKGVTFDTGGISLKNALNMHEMKGDMGGAAVVLGTMVTAARLGISQNIVGLIPSAENMPSGHATRPGDIVTSRNGKTIEVINTDAEGRLLLADGLDYANSFDPQAVFDIATLTGATLYILGYSGAPIMGNNEKLLSRLREAADNTAERVWPLPIWDDHRKQMKSPIADLTNSGGRPAGTISAGAFLENFVGDWPWAHIDIAYVDVEPSGKPYVPKGVTGFGMRLLVEALTNWKRL